jgi:hypothetical protein
VKGLGEKISEGIGTKSQKERKIKELGSRKDGRERNREQERAKEKGEATVEFGIFILSVFSNSPIFILCSKIEILIKTQYM